MTEEERQTYSRPDSPSNFYVDFDDETTALLGSVRRDFDRGYFASDDSRAPRHDHRRLPRWMARLFGR